MSKASPSLAFTFKAPLIFLSRYCNALVAAIVVTTLAGCSYFPESSFTLAVDSRLPKWIKLQPGQTRADITVTMDYYISDRSGRTATFSVSNSFGLTTQRVSGELRGLYPIERSIRLPGFPEGYPSYEIISVGDQVEIIEHRRMEPIFYVTDDPDVLSELAAYR